MAAIAAKLAPGTSWDEALTIDWGGVRQFVTLPGWEHLRCAQMEVHKARLRGLPGQLLHDWLQARSHCDMNSLNSETNETETIMAVPA